MSCKGETSMKLIFFKYKMNIYKMLFTLLIYQSTYADVMVTKEYVTQSSGQQKPRTDEERTDHIENVMKTSFAKIFAGIINALQNPKQKAHYVADCINAMLNVIWEATRDKKIEEWEEIFKVINEICDSIDDQEIAQEIKKIIQEDHEAKRLLIAQNK